MYMYNMLVCLVHTCIHVLVSLIGSLSSNSAKAKEGLTTPPKPQGGWAASHVILTAGYTAPAGTDAMQERAREVTWTHPQTITCLPDAGRVPAKGSLSNWNICTYSVTTQV